MTREELREGFREVLGLHATWWRMSTCLALADVWAIDCHDYWTGEAMKLKPAGKAASLNRAARIGTVPRVRAPQCRACLSETGELTPDWVCTDRAACESRQPPLFHVEPDPGIVL